MAVITIDARPMSVIFDCPRCGPPAPLTRRDELRDIEKLIRDHQRSTGHQPRVIKQGTSYLTLRFDGCEITSGPMPRG